MLLGPAPSHSQSTELLIVFPLHDPNSASAAGLAFLNPDSGEIIRSEAVPLWGFDPPNFHPSLDGQIIYLDHETYQAELSKTRREIEQLKAKHTSTGNQNVIEGLQQELAKKESRYEDELLLLRKELKLNQKSYRELTEEHSRLVDR